jgi:uncharacterized protein (DUF952 family)
MLLHIISQAAWRQAKSAGVYRPESLETEGFIHLSYPHQLLQPANALYAGHQDLLLLVINPTQLTAKVVVEDSYGTGEEFPHLYGQLDPMIVRRVVAFPCGPDGRFSLPEGLLEDGS